MDDKCPHCGLVYTWYEVPYCSTCANPLERHNQQLRTELQAANKRIKELEAKLAKAEAVYHVGGLDVERK